MKPLACRCGQAVYLDNLRCESCGRALAFDPSSLTMRSEAEPGGGLDACANRSAEIRCNWLAEAEADLCVSCQSSAVIPALSKPENRDRWRKLERAKRRLLYDLLGLHLPVDAAHLRFVFKEDRRTNPHVHEEHVAIGHSEGVITINAAEADDVYREEMRVTMNEPYRTLLGHFRHEAGHYYFDRLIDAENREAARALFGDETMAYDDALEQYYRDGPAAAWQQRFISAYASAHPLEDWAETFAHYLHIRAVLETVEAYGIDVSDGERLWRERFVDVAITLNEIMRSLGLGDAYPFVISAAVATKLDFVADTVRRFTDRRDAPSTAGR